MNRRGVAQLLALWALLLLGTLALSFSYGMRTEAIASRNGFDADRAYYQARTGIARTLALLSYLPVDNVAAMRIAEEEGDLSYSVSLEPEGGKIDVNLAPETLILGVLEGSGLSPEEALRVGEAILDWRDPDDRPRDFGAEEPYYAGLPEPIRPRNGRLERVEELRFVRGVTPELYDRFLSKVFTVSSNLPQVNVNLASYELLAALPGMTPELARAVVDRRKETPFATLPEILQFFQGTEVPQTTVGLLSSFGSPGVYVITSRGRAGRAVSRTVRCVVEIRGATILRWEDQVSSPEENG